jgi:hypothetical protein
MPNNLSSEAPAEKRGRGRPKKSKAQEDKPTQSSWFVEGEDGYSDMDIVALWCAEEDNFDRWKGTIKIQMAGVLSEYMSQKNRPGRKPKECNKKVCTHLTL